ncbi:MAG TPA: response regulator [Candidatus Blautia faecigallinarum]|uniref:Stage 0 sporulation protein A homolog n=1 Tax=Candidatus Blautia faecigallinarum TaxID=2838488 RepID=A0A9D2DT91_9FIRM|nr:response regulator [Candidatus Blautia faecigallinarum]
MKTIVVIEDELFFRKSVCKILEKQKDFQIVGETNNGLSGAEMIRDLNPDIAIVDISMPLMNGLEMIRQV